jgi:hypothetical protein
VLTAIGLVVAGQSHLLGWVLIAPLGLLALAEVRRDRAGAGPWLLAALAIVGASFLPLVAHEISTGMSEVRALVDGSNASAAATGPPVLLRVFFVPLRILAVPLVRDVVASVAVTTAAAALVVGAAAVASARGSPVSLPGRALTGGLIVGIAILALSTSWLATVTPLYVDHYFLALTPSIFALVGLGASVIRRRRIGRIVILFVVITVVAWNVLAVRLPAVAGDGGWPAGLAAARRVVASTDGAASTVIGVPEFKKTTALDYPLTVIGRAPVAVAEATRVAVLCDALFEEVVGLPCGGAAESARLAELGIPEGARLDRFEAAPGRWISVYEIAGR